MRNMGLKSAIAGGLLSLGLVAGAGLASAHGGPGGHGVRGTISSPVANNTFQVQPASGSPVTVNLTATTKVIHREAGTTQDLTKGVQVSLRFAAGTTTVNAIEINTLARPTGLTKTKTKTTTTTTTTHTKGMKRKTTTTTTTTTTHTRAVHTGGPHGAFGTVFSLSGNTLTITGHNGAQTAYALANNVTITKTVAGQQSDLKQGHTVQVQFARGSTTNAALITIFGA